MRMHTDNRQKFKESEAVYNNEGCSLSRNT